MFDYEALRFIWWVLIGVLFIGFAGSQMVSIWEWGSVSPTDCVNGSLSVV